MREVAPGDVIFSFVDTFVAAIGGARSHCWEHQIESGISKDASLAPTDREAIIRARRGQGAFKQGVMAIEKSCRITRVTNPVHLIASHCKPWRDSNNDERLNPENGLLLTP